MHPEGRLQAGSSEGSRWSVVRNGLGDLPSPSSRHHQRVPAHQMQIGVSYTGTRTVNDRPGNGRGLGSSSVQAHDLERVVETF